MRHSIVIEGTNSMAVLISKEVYFRASGKLPVQGDDVEYLTFDNLDIYIIYYGNHHSMANMKVSDLFYISEYPVLIKDDKYPSLDIKKIPGYLFENKTVSTNESGWMVVICRDSREYIVIHNINSIEDDDLIKQIKLFQKECTGD